MEGEGISVACECAVVGGDATENGQLVLVFNVSDASEELCCREGVGGVFCARGEDFDLIGDIGSIVNCKDADIDGFGDGERIG